MNGTINTEKPFRLPVSGFLIVIFMAFIVTITIYPVIYALLGSLKTNQELTTGGNIIPEKFMWGNYYDAFIKSKFLRYSVNSLIVSIGSMVLALITTSLAGYTLARHWFPGKKILLGVYTAMMFVSLGSVTLYPIYIFLNRLGMTRNLSGLILTLTGGQIANVLLVMGFVRNVPRELDEAAVIDGYSSFGIYWRIMLPMIRPVLGVVALFAFRNAWNDYITTLIMTIPRPDLMTVTVAVVQMKYNVNAAAEWHLMLAGASLAIIPILIVYFFTNRQFISGLTAGALKG